MKRQLDKGELDKAIAQFIGYKAAKNGDSIIALTKAMGLTKAEYEAIRDDIALAHYTDDRSELDEYFRRPPDRCTVAGIIMGPLYCFGFLIFVLIGSVQWIYKRPVWDRPIIARRRTKEFYELHDVAEAHITPEKYKAGQWMD